VCEDKDNISVPQPALIYRKHGTKLVTTYDRFDDHDPGWSYSIKQPTTYYYYQGRCCSEQDFITWKNEEELRLRKERNIKLALDTARGLSPGTYQWRENGAGATILMCGVSVYSEEDALNDDNYSSDEEGHYQYRSHCSTSAYEQRDVVVFKVAFTELDGNTHITLTGTPENPGISTVKVINHHGLNPNSAPIVVRTHPALDQVQ